MKEEKHRPERYDVRRYAGTLNLLLSYLKYHKPSHPSFFNSPRNSFLRWRQDHKIHTKVREKLSTVGKCHAAPFICHPLECTYLRGKAKEAHFGEILGDLWSTSCLFGVYSSEKAKNMFMKKDEEIQHQRGPTVGKEKTNVPEGFYPHPNTSCSYVKFIIHVNATNVCICLMLTLYK